MHSLEETIFEAENSASISTKHFFFFFFFLLLDERACQTAKELSYSFSSASMRLHLIEWPTLMRRLTVSVACVWVLVKLIHMLYG